MDRGRVERVISIVHQMLSKKDQLQTVILLIWLGAIRLNLSQPSRRIRVVLLSYENKTSDKQEQYDQMAANNLDG